MNNTSYLIVDEFKTLLPPLTGDQRETLKSLIRQHGGCINPLLVWREENILLDGHHRHEIMQELMAEGYTVSPPRIEQLSFSDRLAAKEWVLQHSEGQRNLTKYEAARNVLLNSELVEQIKAAATDRMKGGVITANGDPRSIQTKGDTLSKLAEFAGVKRATLYQAQTVLKYPDLDKEVLREKKSLNVAFQEAKKRLEEAEGNATADAKAQGITAVERAVEAEVGAPIDQILNVDVLDGFKMIEKACVSLVLTSPPYPITAVEYPNWKYDGDYAKYMAWMESVFREAYRVLRDGGRLALQFDTPNIPAEERGSDGKLRHNLYQDFSNLMEKIGFVYRDTVLWYKQNCVGNRPVVGSPQKSPRIQRNWEYILIFHKGSASLDGDERLMDLTTDEFHQWTIGHWAIKPENKHRNKHRCPFPLEIPHRLTKLYTYRGDIVLDPFSGSGTTCLAAAKLGRRYVGFENCPRYAMQARERIQSQVGQKPKPQPDLVAAA